MRKIILLIAVSSDLQSLVYYSPKDGSSATIQLEVPRKLDEAIKAAESIDQSLYTPKSVELLNNELEDAYYVLENATTQFEIDLEADNLNYAIKALVELANKEQLNKLISEVHSYPESDYESKSFNNLQTELKEAIAISEDPNASQSTVDEATSQLQVVINGLAFITLDITEADNTGEDKSEQTSSEDSSSDQATLNETGFWSGVGIVAVSVLIASSYLKKKANS